MADNRMNQLKQIQEEKFYKVKADALLKELKKFLTGMNHDAPDNLDEIVKLKTQLESNDDFKSVEHFDQYFSLFKQYDNAFNNALLASERLRQEEDLEKMSQHSGLHAAIAKIDSILSTKSMLIDLVYFNLSIVTQELNSLLKDLDEYQRQKFFSDYTKHDSLVAQMDSFIAQINNLKDKLPEASIFATNNNNDIDIKKILVSLNAAIDGMQSLKTLPEETAKENQKLINPVLAHLKDAIFNCEFYLKQRRQNEPTNNDVAVQTTKPPMLEWKSYKQLPPELKKSVFGELLKQGKMDDLIQLRQVSTNDKEIVDQLLTAYLNSLYNKKNYKQLLILYHDYPYFANKLLADKNLMNVDLNTAIQLLHQLSGDNVYLALEFVELFRKKDAYKDLQQYVMSLTETQIAKMIPSSEPAELEKLIADLACFIQTRMNISDKKCLELCRWYHFAVHQLCDLTHLDLAAYKREHPEYIAIDTIQSAAEYSFYLQSCNDPDWQANLIAAMNDVSDYYINLTNLALISTGNQCLDFSDLSLSGKDFQGATLRFLKIDDANFAPCRFLLKDSYSILTKSKVVLIDDHSCTNSHTLKKALDRIGMTFLINGHVPSDFIYEDLSRIIVDKKTKLSFSNLDQYINEERKMIKMLELASEHPVFKNNKKIQDDLRDHIGPIRSDLIASIYIKEMASKTNQDVINDINHFIDFLSKKVPKKRSTFGFLSAAHAQETDKLIAKLQALQELGAVNEKLKANFSKYLHEYVLYLIKEKSERTLPKLIEFIGKMNATTELAPSILPTRSNAPSRDF